MPIFYMTRAQITLRKKTKRILAIELIGDYSSRKRPGWPSISGPPSTRFCLAQYPMQASSGTSHRCHYSHNKKHQYHFTKWYCNDCQLCLYHTGHTETDCFHKYHTQHILTDN